MLPVEHFRASPALARFACGFQFPNWHHPADSAHFCDTQEVCPTFCLFVCHEQPRVGQQMRTAATDCPFVSRRRWLAITSELVDVSVLASGYECVARMANPARQVLGAREHSLGRGEVA